MQNYIRLRKFSFHYSHFMFIDTPEYLADSLFKDEQIEVYFGQEGKKEKCPYIVIFCKIRKRDEEKFLKALGRLENKMLLMGHRDYGEFCRNIFEELSRIRKK